MWESEREGPDEVFAMTSEIVALDGDTAVVRVEVKYAIRSTGSTATSGSSGSARTAGAVAFEEWPFFPGQPLSSKALPSSRAARYLADPGR